MYSTTSRSQKPANMRVSRNSPDWTFEERCGNMHTAGYVTVCANPGRKKVGMHNKLTRTFVKNVTKDGLYNDGGGLNLQVRGASKIWMFGYRDRVTGKKRSLSLGPDHTVDQERAREEAKKYRDLLRDGKDPLAARNGLLHAKRLAKTVNDVLDEYRDMRIAHRSANTIRNAGYLLQNHVRAKSGAPLDGRF